MRLRRSPLPFWALALALALGTGLTVGRVARQASQRAAELGGLVDVPVAARAVDAGRRLGAADVTRRRLPAALVPRGRRVPSAVGRVALVPLAAGEVLLAAKLAPDGLRGVAALVPAGQRALAVPVDPAGLALQVGHRVDVLATFEVAGPGAGDEAPTFPVATAALVVDVADEAVTIAVPPAQAARVAFALARGTVTLALTAP
ncbi:MAG: Flp pilus assembly protein CpaB [Actinomycetota bacterium]